MVRFMPYQSSGEPFPSRRNKVGVSLWQAINLVGGAEPKTPSVVVEFLCDSK
jgi:hypothetical protein